MNDAVPPSFFRRLGARLARAARRSRKPAAAAGCYVLLAVVVLSPLASKFMPETGAQDLANHVSGIIEARDALVEGQFPIRVAPRENNGERYPIFQFYGNLSYTAGGLLYLAGMDPYQAWKVVVGLALVVGGFYIYRCCRRRTRAFWPSFAAGAVFITAPYTLCDLHGRVAYSEIISLGLLPVVYFYLMRTLARPRPGPALASAVAWTALCLTHAITFFLASLFFGLYTATHFPWVACFRGLSRLGGRNGALAGPRKHGALKSLRRLAFVGAAYALGLGLSAWYVGPQLYLLPRLAGGLAFEVGKTAWLTPLGVLLAPTVVPPVPLPTILISMPMHFGLQIGWPILAAAAAAVYGLATRRAELRPARGTVARLLLFFGLAAFMAWTPFDFWKHLPALFKFVQFPYRVLMFVVLWGALLSGHALTLLFRRQMRFEQTVACLLVLGLFTSPYLSPYQSPMQLDPADEVRHPNMGRGGACGVYLLSLQAQHENMRDHPSAPGHAAVLLGSGEVPIETRTGKTTRCRFTLAVPRFVQLPVLYYPGVLDVRDNGARVAYGNFGRLLALNLSEGGHSVTIRFVGLPECNLVSLACWLAVLGGGVWLAAARFRRRRTPSAAPCPAAHAPGTPPRVAA